MCFHVTLKWEGLNVLKMCSVRGCASAPPTEHQGQRREDSSGADSLRCAGPLPYVQSSRATFAQPSEAGRATRLPDRTANSPATYREVCTRCHCTGIKHLYVLNKVQLGLT